MNKRRKKMDTDQISTEEFKIVTIGDSGVGKTSIVKRYADGIFDEKTPSTIGAAYVKVTVNTMNTTVTMNVWDTAGQERFQSLIPLYLRSAAVCLLIVDLSHENPVAQANNILESLEAMIPNAMNIILVGNKRDKVSEDFDSSPLYQWADKHKFPCLLTSAKTGEGIDELFSHIGLVCLQHRGEVQDDSYTSQGLESEKGKAFSCCK